MKKSSWTVQLASWTKCQKTLPKTTHIPHLLTTTPNLPRTSILKIRNFCFFENGVLGGKNHNPPTPLFSKPLRLLKKRLPRTLDFEKQMKFLNFRENQVLGKNQKTQPTPSTKPSTNNTTPRWNISIFVLLFSFNELSVEGAGEARAFVNSRWIYRIEI